MTDETNKTKIIIDSSDHNGGKPIVVNGQFRFRIPYNTEFDVDDAELEVLRNSNTEFRIVGDPASSAPAGAEGALAPAGDPQARASAQAFGGTSDSAEDRQPIRPLANDERAGTEAAIALQLEERERKVKEAREIEAANRKPGSEAEQADSDAAAASGDSKAEEPDPDAEEGQSADQEQGNEGPAPGTEDAGTDKADSSGDTARGDAGNEGPAPGADASDEEQRQRQNGQSKADAEGSDSDEGDLNGGRFSAVKVLEQPIAKITEDMDEFTPRQVRSLLDHEKKGQNRSTLITALEKKQAAAE